MKESRNPAGLVLAAGFSSRMKGDFKPLMKIGGSCPLGILTDSMRTAGINDIYVVTGHRAEDVEGCLRERGSDVKCVYNENFADGMFTSIKKGVSAAAEDGHDCFVMTPVDVPLIPPYVFRTVMDKFYDSDRTEFVVACCGKKAHPLVIPAALTEEVLGSTGENGMKSVTAPHEDRMIKADTHCRSILYDMDTKQDYRELLEFYRTHKYPSEEQCWRILNRIGTPAHIVKHCRAVTDTAVTIAKALNKHGYFLSLPLIQAAGMLHDVLRMKPNHDIEGAKLLLNYGYPEVAELIRDHMRYQHPLPVYEVTEKDIICLADKLRQEDKLVTLEQRLAPVLQRWQNDKEAVRDIESKIGCTYAVMNYINIRIGETVYELLRRHDAENFRENDRTLRRVILIRHGETERHPGGKIFLGQTDVSLDERGQEQCMIAGIELQHFDIDTSTVYVSDLKRAVESAEIIIKNVGLDLNIEKIPEFREMNLGSWDGRYISEIRENYPEEYEKRGRDMLGYRIDGGAENFYDLRARVIRKFNEIVQKEEKDIVIVAHSGVLRVLKCELTGRPLSDIVGMKFDRGGYEIFDLTREYAERYKLEIE